MKNIDIINKVKKVDPLETKVNTLENAVNNIDLTSEKVKMKDGTTLQASFDGLKQSVSNGKTEIASAITDKGISTSNSATFTQMATNIRSIKGLPEGWDREETGSVLGNDITKGDACVWQSYGDWSTSVDKVPLPSDFPTTIRISAWSSDGKYLALGITVSPYLVIYKVDNKSNTFTKLPNPLVMPTSQPYAMKFTLDTNTLMLCPMNLTGMIIYKRAGDTFSSSIKPTFGNEGNITLRGADLSDDGTVMGIYDYYSGSSSPYRQRIARYDKSNNTWTMDVNTGSSISGNSPGRRIVCDPAGRYVLMYGSTEMSGDIYYKDTLGVFKQAYSGGVPSCRYLELSADGNKALFGYRSSSAPLSTATIECAPEASTPVKITLRKGFYSDTVGNMNYGMFISPNRKHLIVCDSLTKFNRLFIVDFEAETLTPVSGMPPNSDTERIASPDACAFSGDENYLIMSFNTTPSTIIYRTTAMNAVSPVSSFVPGQLRTSLIGVAEESKRVGEQIKVSLFPKLTIQPQEV